MLPSMDVYQMGSSEEIHTVPEGFVDTATDQMWKDPALHQMIRSSVLLALSDVPNDIFKRINDIEHRLHKRMDRLERLVADSQSGRMPVQLCSYAGQQGMEPPHHVEAPFRRLSHSELLIYTGNQPGTPRGPSPPARHTDPGHVLLRDPSFSGPPCHPTPRSAPPPDRGMPRRASVLRSSPHSVPQITWHGPASARPSQAAGGSRSGHSPSRSPMPRGAQLPGVPLSARDFMDWHLTQIHEDMVRADEDMRRALRQQQQHRRGRGGQDNMGGLSGAVPEPPTAPGGQGRRSTRYAAEDDHHEARRSESSTTKEKRPGRWTQLLGKHSWWSRKTPK
mmetsp:Transcript_108995/g.319009  ORF Transcript_108995/g.319009 Transcript_108995/m.319009 type:complete len:335 (+) Transcript_108995:98-1102(+)